MPFVLGQVNINFAPPAKPEAWWIPYVPLIAALVAAGVALFVYWGNKIISERNEQRKLNVAEADKRIETLTQLLEAVTLWADPSADNITTSSATEYAELVRLGDKYGIHPASLAEVVSGPIANQGNSYSYAVTLGEVLKDALEEIDGHLRIGGYSAAQVESIAERLNLALRDLLYWEIVCKQRIIRGNISVEPPPTSELSGSALRRQAEHWDHANDRAAPLPEDIEATKEWRNSMRDELIALNYSVARTVIRAVLPWNF